MAQGKVLRARSKKGSRSRFQRPPCRVLARPPRPGGCLPLPGHAQVVGYLRPPLKGTPRHVIRGLFVSADARKSITNRMTYETIALEMRHRLKNAFAVSSAITRISACASPEHQSFAEALVNRFSSLAVAQAKPEGLHQIFLCEGSAQILSEQKAYVLKPSMSLVFRNAAPRTARLVSGHRIKTKPPSRFTGWRSAHGQTYVGGSLAGAGSSAVCRRGEGPPGSSGYAPSSECVCNKRDHEKDEENDEQELCDACSGASDAAEARQSSDDRQYEKCQRPTEHVCLHFLCPTIQAVYGFTTPVIRKSSGKIPHQVFCLHRFPW